MKNSLKITTWCCVFITALMISAPLKSQTDSILIKQAALNYAEGFYSGDVQRMEKAVYQDLNKVTPANSGNNGNIVLNYTTYSQLLEFTRAKTGFLDEPKRNLKVNILNINADFANVKITSSSFNDYLQLVRAEGQWKIINVLWSGNPPRIKDFKTEKETEAIYEAVVHYAEGIMLGDAKRIESAIHPEMNKITFRTIPATGKITFRRAGMATLTENALNKTGRLDDCKIDYEIKILDAMDGMAIVELKTPYYNEHRFSRENSMRKNYE